jgi:hypothetical protein
MLGSDASFVKYEKRASICVNHSTPIGTLPVLAASAMESACRKGFFGIARGGAALP